MHGGLHPDVDIVWCMLLFCEKPPTTTFHLRIRNPQKLSQPGTATLSIPRGRFSGPSMEAKCCYLDRYIIVRYIFTYVSLLLG
jgi:hypothetical protein